MDFSNVKKIAIDGKEVKKIEINGVIAWQGGYTNLIPTSINADGTIYNGTGYKEGYRVRSGGAEGAQNNATCSGYIPVKAGDIVRVSGINFFYDTSSNAINVSDSNFTNLGQLVANNAKWNYGIFTNEGGYYDYGWYSVVEESTGVYKWVVPPATSKVAYIRITGYTMDGEKMIATVNEEIEE